METTFPIEGTLQAIGLALLGIALTVGTLALILRQVSSKSIEASDGCKFSSEEECRLYEIALQKLKPLYEINASNTNNTYGFNQDFLEILKNKGFNDLKTLLKYSSEIQKLSELLKNE